jgi:hypothetical protein
MDFRSFHQTDPGQPPLAELDSQFRDDFRGDSDAHRYRLGRLARSQAEQGLSLLSPGRFTRAYKAFERRAVVWAEINRHRVVSLFDHSGR